MVLQNTLSALKIFYY